MHYICENMSVTTGLQRNWVVRICDQQEERYIGVSHCSAAASWTRYDVRVQERSGVKTKRWWTQWTTARRPLTRYYQSTTCRRTTATIISITSSIISREEAEEQAAVPAPGCYRARRRPIATRERASRRRRSTHRTRRCSHCRRVAISTRRPARRGFSAARPSAADFPASWRTWASTRTRRTSTTSSTECRRTARRRRRRSAAEVATEWSTTGTAADTISPVWRPFTTTRAPEVDTCRPTGSSCRRPPTTSRCSTPSRRHLRWCRPGHRRPSPRTIRTHGAGCWPSRPPVRRRRRLEPPPRRCFCRRRRPVRCRRRTAVIICYRIIITRVRRPCRRRRGRYTTPWRRPPALIGRCTVAGSPWARCAVRAASRPAARCPEHRTVTTSRRSTLASWPRRSAPSWSDTAFLRRCSRSGSSAAAKAPSVICCVIPNRGANWSQDAKRSVACGSGFRNQNINACRLLGSQVGLSLLYLSFFTCPINRMF